jgi:hypothetical protein
MLINWYALAIAGGLCSNAFNIVNRVTLKKNKDSTAFAWWFESFRLVIFAILSLFDFYLILNLKNIFLLLSLGFTELVAIYFFMKMHSQA